MDTDRLDRTAKQFQMFLRDTFKAAVEDAVDSRFRNLHEELSAIRQDIASMRGRDERPPINTMRFRYWTEFQARLKVVDGPVVGTRQFKNQSWLRYPLGMSFAHLKVAMNSRKKFVKVEVYLSGPDADKHLKLIELNRGEIEDELGYSLEWGDQKPEAQDRTISCYFKDVHPFDERDWSRQHEWLVKCVNEMHYAFSRRLKELWETGTPRRVYGD